MPDYKEELRELLAEIAVIRGEVTLSSGEKSNYYIDCRRATLSAKGSFLIGEILSDMMENADAVGGLTMGADPIATSVAVRSYEKGQPVDAFLVRKDQKAHGMMKRIEGPVKEHAKVIIVDDVITKGGSVLEAIDAVEEAGHSVLKIICLVDREQGGAEKIRDTGHRLETLFKATDLGI